MGRRKCEICLLQNLILNKLHSLKNQPLHQFHKNVYQTLVLLFPQRAVHISIQI